MGRGILHTNVSDLIDPDVRGNLSLTSLLLSLDTSRQPAGSQDFHLAPLAQPCVQRIFGQGGRRKRGP